MKNILIILLIASTFCWAETNKYNVLFIAIDDLRPELGWFVDACKAYITYLCPTGNYFF